MQNLIGCSSNNNDTVSTPPTIDNSDVDVINTPTENNELYFPDLNSDLWETKTIKSLKWNENAVNELYSFLSNSNTRGFILLHEGKIILEKYWGKDILNISDFTKDTNWYWASAGKTLTAFLVGLAQEQQLLNITDKTSMYLGEKWTSLPKEKEDLITVWNQLTMTTGLDYKVPNIDCTTPDCLKYNKDSGTQWYYHNAPYTLLESVVSNAAKKSYNDFTDEAIETKIGMEGFWASIGDNNVYWSSARSAARFGLLLLNKGKWKDSQIMKDEEYYGKMVNSSQSLNPSYGYLTWLNGKSPTIFPGLASPFNISLSEDAPTDLFAAMGKNGQIIDVVPSKKIVVVRFGEAPDDSLVPVAFHNDMWKKINAVFINQ